MSQEFSLLLACVIPGGLIGLAIGLLLRRYRPAWCLRYAAKTSALPWWAFGGLALVFALVAAGHFTTGHPYFGTAFAFIAALDLLAMTNALLGCESTDKSAK